jgi:hypothetical protein
MSDIPSQTIELFSGHKPFSQLARALGYATFAVDRDPATEPDLVADIRTVAPSLLPAQPLVVWAAPPAAAFNRADRDTHWDQYGDPVSFEAREAMEAFRATLALLAKLDPKWWFIESPYGPLRDFTLMTGFNRGYPTRNRITIDHADYGDLPSFRTDIWTNAFWWQPEKEAISRLARRPSNAAVQSIGQSDYRLPPFAIAEMLEQLDAYQRNASAGFAAPSLDS